LTRDVAHNRNTIGSFAVRHRAESTIARFEVNVRIRRAALRQTTLVLSY
jgi:hypothetical protein